jgi:uncharacterized protein
MACLCALPASSAAQRSSPNPHLRDTHSAYLQRASRQPVEGYPWGAEAWRRARETDRSVLLDLGAICCLFCEPVNRESYSQPDTADINRHFVAVKVHYDAQPELAATIERAQAVLNLPAGLPLTAFLAPSGKLYLVAATFDVGLRAASPLFGRFSSRPCASMASSGPRSNGMALT